MYAFDKLPVHPSGTAAVRPILKGKLATGESVDTLFDGPAWIAQDSPGQSDYRAFYRRGCIGWISRRSSQ